MKFTLLCSLLLFLCLPILAQDTGLRISPTHPQYWQYDGKDILLLGGTDEDNLFQMKEVEKHLELLHQVGGNYVRCTMSSRDKGNVWAFYYEEEKDKSDLDRWNEDYWSRFAEFLKICADLDIIIQIEIWATFDFYRTPWNDNPFNPKNNLNYNKKRVDLPDTIPTHPIYTDNPFFRAVPLLENNMKLLEYQQKFVDQLLTHTFKYDNILYCMDNETSVSASWGKFWAEYLQKRAQEEGKQIYCTEMWDPWDLNHLAHRESFDHPETYQFVEMSQNNHNKGDEHWTNGLYQIERLRKNGYLRPLTNIKIYGSDDGQHGGNDQDGIEKFSRNILMGASSARFHRPTSGLGLSKKAQNAIQSWRAIIQKVDFFELSPNNELLNERAAAEAYCRAKEGETYLTYFPNGGTVSIAVEGKVELQWINIDEAKWETIYFNKVNSSLELECPSSSNWVAIVKVV